MIYRCDKCTLYKRIGALTLSNFVRVFTVKLRGHKLALSGFGIPNVVKRSIPIIFCLDIYISRLDIMCTTQKLRGMSPCIGDISFSDIQHEQLDLDASK